ncbi:MAG: hypothetical protein JKY19_05850 [Alcanivoracaceae bacterium]|nr:hypothetical protein [Alcanivoracaceae bacterium]
MINLSSQICEELNLTYWQLNKAEGSLLENRYTITRDEKELLRKILSAKGVKLNNSMLEIRENAVVIINLANHQLIFNDVNNRDTDNIVHLAKIADMLCDAEQKKFTWYKLKNLDL